MAYYEVRVTRSCEEEHTDVVVEASSDKEASRKALNAVLRQPSMHFSHMSSPVVEVTECEELDFVPDQEVIS